MSKALSDTPSLLSSTILPYRQPHLGTMLLENGYDLATDLAIEGKVKCISLSFPVRDKHRTALLSLDASSLSPIPALHMDFFFFNAATLAENALKSALLNPSSEEGKLSLDALPPCF